MKATKPSDVQTDWVHDDIQPVKSGRQLKREGIATVIKHSAEEWRTSYRKAVADWFDGMGVGTSFTGEDLRMAVLARGVRNPRHPNAWGGMASGAISGWLKAGRIEAAGMATASDPKAHARMYPQYRKTQGS